MRKLLWHLVAGTRGGVNRARILVRLKERPRNANELAGELGLDYKTIRHHLKVLRRNDLVMASEEAYGTLYALSPTILRFWEEFEEVRGSLGKK